MDSDMIHNYSEDFQGFAEITGAEEAFRFAREYGVVQITFPADHKEKNAHTQKVADFFGEEVLIKLCEAFGGFGRITIPKCHMLQAQLNTLKIIAEIETMGKSNDEIAQAYGMTSHNVRHIIQVENAKRDVPLNLRRLEHPVWSLKGKGMLKQLSIKFPNILNKRKK